MSSLINFFQSPHILALLIAVLIFLTTIFLVVKQWIGFWITLLFLLFSLAAGLMINHQQSFQNYLSSHRIEDTQDAFRKQVMKAVEDLKIEVHAEKENLNRVMNQIQEIFESVDIQKQKLQNFIEETKEHFKTEYPTKSLLNPSEESEEKTSAHAQVNNYEDQF